MQYFNFHVNPIHSINTRRLHKIKTSVHCTGQKFTKLMYQLCLLHWEEIITSFPLCVDRGSTEFSITCFDIIIDRERFSSYNSQKQTERKRNIDKYDYIHIDISNIYILIYSSTLPIKVVLWYLPLDVLVAVPFNLGLLSTANLRVHRPVSR